MLKSMKDGGRLLDSSDIARLENYIGGTLPNSYKEFLLQYNGGRPEPGCFHIIGTGNTTIGLLSSVMFFYWIDGPNNENDTIRKSYDIRECYEIFQGRMPMGFLPIACDEGGNQICLSLDGKDAGRMWYWDHEAEKDIPDHSNCYLIANTFDQFLDDLFDDF